ncbi:unnamed protein product, partial [marine sediment metagenome]
GNTVEEILDEPGCTEPLPGSDQPEQGKKAQRTREGRRSSV